MASNDLLSLRLTDTPVKRGAPVPRWHRVQQQQQPFVQSSSLNATSHSCSFALNEHQSTPMKCSAVDRFIPSRAAMDLEWTACQMKENRINEASVDSPMKQEYRRNIAKTLFPSQPDSEEGTRILSFKQTLPENKDNVRALYMNKSKFGVPSPLRVRKATAQAMAASQGTARVMPTQPDRVLDAPGMLDDYYLNLLDWSSQNVVAVALSRTVYLWNATSGSVRELVTLEAEDDYVCSVSWVQDGSYLAVGTATDACVQIWDVEATSRIRTMAGHSARVSSLAWRDHVLSSGARNGDIHHHDVRVAQHHVASLKGHSQEVCGMKWSPDGQYLASGGNDNLVNIWQWGHDQARFTRSQHRAAVKALSWCPWQSNLLATGGGSCDRTIRLWQASTGACVSSVDTGSQVTALQWSREAKELISSHGFADNQLAVWRMNGQSSVNLIKVGEVLNAHQSRILHMALSPDGQSVATAAADENLKFWKMFQGAARSATATTTLSTTTKRVQPASPQFAKGASLR